MARRDSDWVWRQVWWPLPFAPDDAFQILERLAADRHLGELVLEAHATDNTVHYLVGAHRGRIHPLVVAIESLIPDAKVAKPTFDRPRLSLSGRVRLSHPSRALNVDRASSVSRAVLAGLAQARDNEHLVVQARLGGRTTPSFPPTGQAGSWLDVLHGTPPPRESEEHARVRVRYGSHGFHTAIRIGAATSSDTRSRELVAAVLAGMRTAEALGVRIGLTTESPSRLIDARRPWSWGPTLSARELAPLLAWPIDTSDVRPLPGHPGAHPRVLAGPTNLTPSAHPFAVTTAPGKAHTFGIGRGDSLQHTLLLGPTASGKSVAMLAMIEDAINDGRGVLVIDPKTDLVNDVLARIPEHRKHDVVVIDPTDPRPVGLNPLRHAGRNPEQVTDALLAVFKELSYDSWGPRTQDVLSSAVLTLARHKGATLTMLPALLTDDRFRHRVLRHVDDIGLRSFWDGYQAMSPEQRAQVIAPTMSRLRQFLLRPTLRAVLGQAEPEFELGDLFTQRRIVLVSLNKGVLGSDGARLLGSLIVGQLWPLILSRAALDPARRHVVNVFIDEVQDYLTLPTDLEDALAQARGLGVGFSIAHQYRRQLPASLRAGVDANARNRIIFGLNADDAAELARQAPTLEARDFMLLPRFGIYATLQRGGSATGWFSARTLPPSQPISDPVELRATSAATYGRDASEIDAAILTASGITTPPAGDPDDPIGRRPRDPEGVS